MGRLVAGLLFAAALCASTTDAFYFLLHVHEKTCFAHEGGTDLATVTVNYVIRNEFGEKGDVKITVADPSKTIISTPRLEYSAARQFTFQTTMAGRYDVCMVRTGGTGSIEVEIDISSEYNQDYRDPAVPISAYQIPIYALTPQLAQSMNEVEYLSARQDRFEVTANSTHTRVIFFTLLNAFLGVGAALWQVWNLRRFFKEKKVV